MISKLRLGAALAAAVVLGGLATQSAKATIVTQNFNFSALQIDGFTFFALIPQGSLPAGSILQTVAVNATLDASVDDTYADDLCIYVDPLPLTAAGLLQVGGFSNLGAANRLFWANGGSPAAGTVVNDSKNVSALNIDLGGAQVWLGNGYGAIGTSGTWTGTASISYTVIPEPAALGLLAPAGLLLGRRRRA
jgi:hypothetical protein